MVWSVQQNFSVALISVQKFGAVAKLGQYRIHCFFLNFGDFDQILHDFENPDWIKPAFFAKFCNLGPNAAIQST
jgi:hypothetical protein